MKELSQIILRKGLFASIKRHLCLTKGHFNNPEEQVEVESLKSEVVLTRLIQIEKKNKVSITRMLYLSRIGADGFLEPFKGGDSELLQLGWLKLDLNS